MEDLKSKVYFIGVHKSDDPQIIKVKLARLLDRSKLLDCIREKDKVAIKIHFGEEANTGYVRPEYVRVINDAIMKRQATSFLADTNALYRGKRTNSQDHLKLAYEHGFSPDVVAAPLIIPDDTKQENVSLVEINQRFIKVASLAKVFVTADAIVGVAHFKGHMMTGFGGALKNLGMGCATRKGKMAQHSDASPVVNVEECTGCGTCAEACPVKAISLEDKKARLQSSLCIGCGSCIAVCPVEAIDVQWEEGAELISQKMAEYAKAVLQGKEKKSVFFNFAIKITQECDCLAKDDPRIAPDIGIFASNDPVSIDLACMDLVNQASGKDIFKEVHPKRDATKQLTYAQQLGLGNLDYELIEL